MNGFKQLKAVLVCIAFVGIGLGLMLEPEVGVAHLITDLGISVRFVGGWFILSGVINAWIGITNRTLNPLWYAVFFFYTVLTWLSSAYDRGVPFPPAFAYSLLSAFLVIDWVLDLKGSQYGEHKSR